MLAAAGAAGPKRDDHVGPNRADETHEVAEDLLAPPLLEGLFRR